VLGAVAEFKKRILVLKLRAARERKRRKGGESKVPSRLAITEAAIVSRMRQLRRKPVKDRRASYAEIAAQLNSERHRNRSGREWSAQMVYHVLNAA
jgi:hypothetical protein